MYLKNSNCINCFWNFKHGNKSLVTNWYIYGISLMSLSNTEMLSTIETLISRQSLTLVGPDVEECRVRPLSLLSRPAQQCQLQCGRICKISGNTWSYFYFSFLSFCWLYIIISLEHCSLSLFHQMWLPYSFL